MQKPSWVGLAAAESHKGEDRYSSLLKDRLYGFGLFDGHGGPDCAKHCASTEAEGILPQVLSGSHLPTHETIADAFWTADAVCGPVMAARGKKEGLKKGGHAGSTATILLVEALPGKKEQAADATADATSPNKKGKQKSGGFKCLFAWVGDSTALAVNMSNGQICSQTINHTPDQPIEAANLKLMSAAGKQLKKVAARGRRPSVMIREAEAAAVANGGVAADEEEEEEEEVEEEAVTLAHVGAALKRAGVVPSDTCPQELLLRAFEREQLIFKSIPKGRKYRHNAVIMNRPAAKDENMPLVCATHEDPYSSHYRDLLMTRSICDWTKSSWVLPHPDVVHFDVAHGKHVRTVLASDGLWDICSADEAAAILKSAPTPQKAADELLEIAKRVYQGERGLEKMGDDTTIMVVDLMPGGKAAAGSASSCALS